MPNIHILSRSLYLQNSVIEHKPDTSLLSIPMILRFVNRNDHFSGDKFFMNAM